MSKKSVIGTTSVGVLSSILAFLGVVSCCATGNNCCGTTETDEQQKPEESTKIEPADTSKCSCSGNC